MSSYALGDTIDDRYKVIGMLGKGAHGVVYAATDEMLGSKVAVKCLSADLASDPNFKTRMHREARAMGVLSGTSAAQIFAFNKAQTGELYIVMELLAGRDLEAYLRELEKHGAHIELKRLVNLLGSIAETLDIAHDQNLVHRDIKPGNIFVLDSMVRGGVRLLDFGLAKDLNATSLTQDGMIAGSPGYIAPEIWRGRAKDADRPRARRGAAVRFAPAARSLLARGHARRAAELEEVATGAAHHDRRLGREGACSRPHRPVQHRREDVEHAALGRRDASAEDADAEARRRSVGGRDRRRNRGRGRDVAW
jgi:eukaryotic-like serine/threonine-protein kinase